MFVESPFDHTGLDAALAQLRLGITASELHGSLCGYLCGGGHAGAGGVLQALELESDDTGSADQAHVLVHEVYRQCRQQLDDVELGFTPLLPEDEQDLELRALALVDWCRGFLGGFGLAGPGAALSEDGREILRDLGAVASTELSFEGGEEDERALMELLEFVRVGALTLHAERAAPPPSSQGPDGALH